MTAEIKKRRFAEGVAVTNPTDLNVGGGSGDGGGATNLNPNPNAAIAVDNGATDDIGDYIDSGTGTVVSKITAGLPLGDVFETGIQIALSAGTDDYTALRFKVPPANRNTQLGYFHYQLTTGYTSGEARIELYRYSDNYVTGEQRVVLRNDDSNEETLIPAYDGLFQTTFDSNSFEYYEMRFINNGATSGSISFNQVTITPDPSTVSGPVVGEAINDSVTESDFSNSTGLTITGNVTTQRFQNAVLVTLQASFSGTGTIASDLRFSLPSHLGSITIPTGAYPSGSNRTDNNTSGDRYANPGNMLADGTNTLGFGVSSALNGNQFGNAGTNIDQIWYSALLPVNEWSGGAQYGSNDVFYFSHDGTSVVYGPEGSSFETDTPAGSREDYDITSVNLTSSDKLSIEMKRADGPWLPDANTKVTSLDRASAAVFVGLGFFTDGSGNYFATRGKYTNTELEPWSTATDYKWRIRVEKEGAASGFGLATSTNSGLVKNYEELTNTLSGDFSGGTLKGTRVGNMVTLTVYSATWTDKNTLLSQAGAIPESMRPISDVVNFTHTETSRGVKVFALADGRIKIDIVTGNYAVAGGLDVLAAPGTDSADVDSRSYSVSYSI